MAQLFFKYGSMNCGKSIDLLKTAHNYYEQGKKAWLMTSSLDTRSGEGIIKSRIGLEASAFSINSRTNIADVISNYTGPDLANPYIDCILIDEAQFLTEEQVIDLAKVVVDQWDIPVICFGLRTDFQGNLFEGSKALFEYADKLDEIKTVCQWCDKKAIMNLRTLNGKPVYDGEQIQIGAEEYLAVCRYHYFHPQLS